MQHWPGRVFQLMSKGVDCDGEGLRVGGVALVARDARGGFAARDAGTLNSSLAKLYGFPVHVENKRSGLNVVAEALTNGELTRAQIAALLMQWPDPPRPGETPDRGRLALALAAANLFKADAEWDAKHPRTGEPPNAGWFATTGGESDDAADPEREPSSTREREPSSTQDIVARAPARPSLLGESLSATALRDLATLAQRLAGPAAFFGALFIPSANPVVEEGAVPERADMSYRWAHDESSVTFGLSVGGQSRLLASGTIESDGLVRDADGEMIARVVSGPDGKQTLVADLGALDDAAAALRASAGATTNARAGDDEPKLCPNPTEEPRTTASENSIRYQEYVSGLPYPWAIYFKGVFFDGCDPKTGDLLEAKAKIDHLFDGDNLLHEWVDPRTNPEEQMDRQAVAAAAGGRQVVWHAQTVAGYRGLTALKGKQWPNISIVYDPN